MKKKKWVGIAVQLLFGAAFGVLVSSIVFANLNNPFRIIIDLAVLVLVYYVQIIVHEVGHLICGLATGYRFVSFRIGAFVVMKKDEKMMVKRMPMKGTGGQCLLKPPPPNEPQPFLLYHMGGSLANLTVTIGALLWIGLFGFSTAAAMFVVVGILFFILNLFPAASPNIPNDGANIQEAKKGKAYLAAMQLQLTVSAELAQGMSLADMPINVFEIGDGLNEVSPFALTLRLFQYNQLQARHELLQAAEKMEDLYKDRENMMPFFQNEVDAERLYCLLAVQGQKQEGEKLFEEKLKKWLPAYDVIDKQRCYYAYLALVQKDDKKAQRCLQKAMKLAETFPYAAIAQTERWLLQDITDKAEKENENEEFGKDT